MTLGPRMATAPISPVATSLPSSSNVLVAEDEQPYLDLAMDSPYEPLAGALCYRYRYRPPGRARHPASTTPVAGRRAGRR